MCCVSVTMYAHINILKKKDKKSTSKTRRIVKKEKRKKRPMNSVDSQIIVKIL